MVDETGIDFQQTPQSNVEKDGEKISPGHNSCLLQLKKWELRSL